jgi:hypothetical protein
MADFVPQSDAGLLAFATPFSTKISATPTAYGLSAANATAYAAAKNDFAAKLAAVQDPATRGEKKSRVHIFWQKRIRAGDTETPWWFPSQTTGGSIREDRLVLPIPPGVRWWDEMPVRVLPVEAGAGRAKQIEYAKSPRTRKPAAKPVPLTTQSRRLSFAPAPPPAPEKAAKKPR